MVSVVTPTFNEADNIVPLIDALHAALSDLPHEIVVVDDDSPDRTWEVAQTISDEDPRVRVVRRFGESGLSSAVMAGLGAARGDVLAVIDADLQHDESILPEMIRRVRVGEVGYTFRNRLHGETKLSPSVIRSYLLAVVELRLGRQVKGEFVLYCLVGASGVLVNLAVFSLAELADLGAIDVGGDTTLRWSLVLGIAASIVSNFLLNNYFTFWERRFRRRRLLLGFVEFAMVSLVGVVVHVAIFRFLQSSGWLNGVVGASTARLVHDAIGYTVALVFNYFLNVNYIWRRRPTW